MSSSGETRSDMVHQSAHQSDQPSAQHARSVEQSPLAFRVRAATASDVPAVLPMVRAICDQHQARDPERFRVVPDVLERYAQWLPERAADPRSVFLVAERTIAHADAGGGSGHSPPGPSEPPDSTPSGSADRGELLGYCVGTIEPEIPIFWVPECGWIHDLWVQPIARRSGVAAALTDETVERFRALGIRQVRLHAGSFNGAAQALFARQGFRACIVEMIKPL
ncbi:MAG: GNAT family N-acetyltransferase [Planctomycetota bacterium]|nr:GNAT family N-acetyltransferase [Planctomycetota bacterium]